ncbi:MAG: SDR family oxidoreductase [Nanoarchaeota archaeon]|nr:SDR family oxidoreductase [Nanoarchaeota archaeon]
MVKNIVVSGGSSGIGLELIKLLLLEFPNCNIIGLSRNISNIDILKKYNNVYVFDVDLTIEKEVINIVEIIFNKFKNIDFLVNNAGAGIIKLIEETSLDDWNSMFNINATSNFLLTREILKKRNSQDFLHILNISSEAGIDAFPTYAAYCAAKFAVTAFSKVLKEEYKNKNVKVNIIYPGDVLTPFMEKCPIDKDLMKKFDIEVLDEKYMLQANDIAKQILYLMKLPKNVEIADVKILPSGDFN